MTVHLWSLLCLWERAQVIAYTAIARSRFAAWGRGSRLRMGAQLEAPHLIAVGADVAIGRNAWLNAADDRGDGQPTLTIGDGTHIGRFTHINAWRDVRIDSHVLIADRVFISDTSHKFADPDKPICRQGDAFEGAVHLKEGCWIGTGAVILPGVTVGRNAIVGANAVVTKNVADFTVVGGVPARFIRQLPTASS